jgi:NAD(P)-dependent dehydrogenase (short-subunit alcohol dehydrogenase family)
MANDREHAWPNVQTLTMEGQSAARAWVAMQDKVVVITGGTSGIGQVAAETFASHGARIVLIARDQARAAETMAKLRAAGPHMKHSLHLADLSSIVQTRSVGEQIAAAEPRIDVLINNAGAVFSRRQLTPEELEMTFATNHMAYFVLTQALLERLMVTAGARVISTSSSAHASGKLNFEDLQSEKTYSGFRAYATSKLCNLLFTRELARRLAGTGVTANCLHPGFVASRFGSQSGGLIQFISPVAKLFAVTPKQGAETIIYLATSPQVAGMTGLYFYKRKPINTSPAAQDDGAAMRLWAASEVIAAGVRCADVR